MKEPGESAFETLWPGQSWSALPPKNRARYAAVEAAVRADEREKNVKAVEEKAVWFDLHGLHDHAGGADAAAAAIRNLGESGA